MKRVFHTMKIRWKVTLWLTLMMTALAAIAIFFLLSTGQYAARYNSKRTLMDAVDRACRELEYEDGEWDMDDLDFFTKGVYLSIYDAEGYLLLGKLPENIQPTQGFRDEKIQKLNQDTTNIYIYDASCVIEDYGEVWIRGIMPSAGTQHALSTMTKVALVIFPFLILLAAWGSYLIVKRAFRPVRQITQTAARIGAGRDLEERIELGDGKDEIYDLAATFDDMLDRLQESFAMEKQFTSDASHELRTPTAVIISQCEFALEEAKQEEEWRGSTEAVLTQARRMSNLISQLLTLARGDKGQVKMNLELINLSELMELVAAQATESAEERGITIRTELEPDILFRGDETMLMRMLLNLIENGIKYGRKGGTLMARLVTQDKRIVGTIRDDGIGIASDELSRIWERFYQVDSARSSSSQGMGLGLSMVRFIVEAHGGTVCVNSELGKGSEFVFEFYQEA